MSFQFIVITKCIHILLNSITIAPYESPDIVI